MACAAAIASFGGPLLYTLGGEGREIAPTAKRPPVCCQDGPVAWRFAGAESRLQCARVRSQGSEPPGEQGECRLLRLWRAAPGDGAGRSVKGAVAWGRLAELFAATASVWDTSKRDALKDGGERLANYFATVLLGLAMLLDALLVPVLVVVCVGCLRRATAAADPWPPLAEPVEAIAELPEAAPEAGGAECGDAEDIAEEAAARIASSAVAIEAAVWAPSARAAILDPHDKGAEGVEEPAAKMFSSAAPMKASVRKASARGGA